MSDQKRKTNSSSKPGFLLSAEEKMEQRAKARGKQKWFRALAEFFSNSQKSTKRCPNCGTSLTNYARKCRYCQTELKSSNKAFEKSLLQTKVTPSITTQSKETAGPIQTEWDNRDEERFPHSAEAFSQIDGAFASPPRLEQETGDAEKAWSTGQVILFFSLGVACLVLVLLWAWYGPFDNQTPSLVLALAVFLSLVCIVGLIIFEIALGHYYYVGFIFLVLSCAVLSLIIGRADELIKEIFVNGEANFTNFIVAIGIFSAIFAGGTFVSDFGDVVSSIFWHLFRSHLRQKKFVTAIGLFLLAVIIFMIFFIGSNLD